MGSSSRTAASRSRTAEIRRFILSHVREHPRDIARLTAENFGISRQAVNQHLQRLVEERSLVSEGHTRGQTYRLVPALQWVKSYSIDDALYEDSVWRTDIQPLLDSLPGNAAHIWLYGFTGIFNNAIDHSEGRHIQVALHRDAAFTELAVIDDGVGVFRKLQPGLGLETERHAALELAKGKITTDPSRHTGEDVYFISRLFDDFDIFSGGLCMYNEVDNIEAWMLEKVCSAAGTAVWMRLDNQTPKILTRLLDGFTTRKEFGFNKTVVPVRLAENGSRLVSRSKARRVIARAEDFRKVVLDFKGVENIGPTFADEIFRVFAREHPRVEIVTVNTAPSVQRMIQRVQLHRERQAPLQPDAGADDAEGEPGR